MGIKRKLVSIKKKPEPEPELDVVLEIKDSCNPGVVDTEIPEETTETPKPLISQEHIEPDNGKTTPVPEMTPEEIDFLNTEKISPDSVEDCNKEIRKMLVDRHNVYSSTRETFISRQSGETEEKMLSKNDDTGSVYDDRNCRVVNGTKRAAKAPVNRKASYLSLNRTM